MSVTYHLRVLGHVQGVGFRYGTARKAREFGVAGWVRNRHDGSVEAMVQGPQAAVDALIEWMRHGPRNARVTDLQISEGSGTYTEFETRPTE